MAFAMILTIGDINALDAAGFVNAFGDVAEHSPWVAKKAFEQRPFGSRSALVAAFEQAMREAPHADQLALVRAHPDLAGKAAIAGNLAEDLRREQAGVGLDRLTKEEFERFTELNGAYREKFGFPFIFAVKGATKTMILEAFATRIASDEVQEFETALQQIARIFRFRLEDRVEQDR